MGLGRFEVGRAIFEALMADGLLMIPKGTTCMRRSRRWRRARRKFLRMEAGILASLRRDAARNFFGRD